MVRKGRHFYGLKTILLMKPGKHGGEARIEHLENDFEPQLYRPAASTIRPTPQPLLVLVGASLFQRRKRVRTREKVCLRRFNGDTLYVGKEFHQMLQIVVRRHRSKWR
jgi:hypothetical protein